MKRAYKGWSVKLVWTVNGKPAYVLTKGNKWAMVFALSEIPRMVAFSDA